MHQHSTTPPPLPYATALTPRRWSPVSLMVLSGCYAGFITAACALGDMHFREVFQDFKVNLPLGTELFLDLSRLVWGDFGWVLLIPLAILWPLLAREVLPLPVTAEGHRRLNRAVIVLSVLIFILSLIAVLCVLFLPMLTLINSVSGPHK